MRNICILTDSAVQFSQPGFAGRDNVRVISYDVELRGQRYPEGEGVKTASLPAAATDALEPHLLAPSYERFLELFQSLAVQYREAIAIFSSSQLTQAFANAEKAARQVKSQISITMIDSQTISVGLGLLVQIAAEGVAKGQSVTEIERQVRHAVPRVYTLLCSSGLSYLHYAGFLDPAQAVVSEMLGLIPICSLEEGRISSIEKARNQRGVLDFFQEFITEFDELQHIAFIQGVAPFNHETHLLREHAQGYYPKTPFSEHAINLPLATLMGPRTMGLIVLEGD